jgi:hypothetical protein
LVIKSVLELVEIMNTTKTETETETETEPETEPETEFVSNY